jgi:serine/threonine-protein kinase
MNNQPDPRETVDTGSPGQGRSADPLTPANQEASPESVGASVLAALAGGLTEMPRVELRDPDGSASGCSPESSQLVPPTRVVVASDPAWGPKQGEPRGRYEQLAEIARGGMGAVLKGRDADLGRDIAVKVLLEAHQSKPGMLVRFIEEAQIGGQLQHPGIVPVYELGTFPDRRPYFTMKLVKGQTLSQLLKERSDLSQDRPRFLKVFEHVCQTLAYAHSRGVIHRDLKPANIMVGAFGEVYVMDWGLAKVLSEGTKDAQRPPPPPEVSIIRTRRSEDSSEGPDGTQTQTGSVLGTPAYMPPEQALGEVDRLDERADVFGLGSILCEILTGEAPYVGRDTAQVHRKAIRADLADAVARLDGSGADAELVGLTKRCLAAEPEDRPRDAGVLTRELTAHLESVEARLRQAELAGAEARARAIEERKRRRLALALGGAVVGLLLLGGGGWVYVAQQRAEREREALAREAEAVRQVQEALSRADNLRQQARADNNPGRWAEARALADRAKSLLADLPAGHEVFERVQTLAVELAAEEQDRKLVERLEEVWLLRADVDAQSPGFALRRSLREYPPLFAEHGLQVGGDQAESAAWLLHRPPQMRERLIAGLDAWLGLARQLKAPEAGWLFGVLQAGDGDAWRKDLRAAVARDDVREVDRLAQSETLARQSPQTVLLLADYFRPRSQDRMTKLLRAAQARYPGDFWINFALADALYQKHFAALSDAKEFEDAVRFYTTALALRPDNLHVQTMLGWSLWLRGRRADGRAVLEQARARRPDYFGPHAYLGAMSMLEGQDREAEAAYRQALELQPRSGMAHAGMGFVLWSRGQYAGASLAFRRMNRCEPFPRFLLGQSALLAHVGCMDEALAVCRECLRFQPDFTEAQLHQRLLLLTRDGHGNEAVALCRGAVLLQPNNPEAHVILWHCLVAQDRFTETRPVARRALEVSPKNPVFPTGLLSQFVRETEQLIALEPQLPAYVKGGQKPHDEQELAMLVTLCWPKQQYVGAAQIYSHAFAADPRLTENVTHEHRYEAARYAALTAAGQGDAAKLDEKERAHWRKQALEWLRADLAGWRKLLEGGSADDRALARERLRWWQEDPKLAGLRDPKALATLPAEEQDVCRQLWADVTALLAKEPQ